MLGSCMRSPDCVRPPALLVTVSMTSASVDKPITRLRLVRLARLSPGLVELVIALITGSVGLLGDALHNLSDVSTSLVVFLGFRISRRTASERYPYGLERAEDLAGLGRSSPKLAVVNRFRRSTRLSKSLTGKLLTQNPMFGQPAGPRRESPLAI